MYERLEPALSLLVSQVDITGYKMSDCVEVHEKITLLF